MMPDIHRSLPHALDAEKGVLGSILLSPLKVIDECIQRGVTEQWFHHPAHGQIFSVILRMRDTGKPVDLISLTSELEKQRKLEEVGGAVAVTELFTFVPTASNAPYYLDILSDKYTRRQLIAAATGCIASAYDDLTLEASEIAAVAEAKIMKAGEGGHEEKEKGIRELALESVDTLEGIYNRKGAITGLATGFQGLDRMLDGLHRGDMIVIAARPSMGKTALAMNIAEYVALDSGRSVGVYSLEMAKRQLVLRMNCTRARVDHKKIREGYIAAGEMSRVIQSATEIADSKLFINDKSGMSILELRSHARRLKAKHDVELIVIDYLQLLKSMTKRGQENRQVEVAEISSGIKALAKELDIPIVVLAQLNRSPDARSGDSKGRPRMSDLRESGAIEQDADVIGLLWRQDYYAEGEEAKKETEGKAELIIAKQRNGDIGEIPLTFLRSITKFEDRAPEFAA